jgi:hypothetical protein
METNELPEDVKRKIEDKLNEGAQLVKSLELDKQVPKGFLDLLLNNNRDFAAWGYRLGLESCEERLKAKDEQAGFALEIESQMQLRIEQDIAKIDSLTSENERLREGLAGIRKEFNGLRKYARDQFSVGITESIVKQIDSLLNRN